MNKIWKKLMLICRHCVEILASLFKIQITNERWFVVEQFIKFTLVGCSNAAVTLIIYNVVVLLFGKDSYIIGQTLGYIAGIFNSYFWNSRLVFNKKEKSKNSFLKMCVCYITTYFLQVGFLYIFVNVCNLSEFISPVLAIILTTPINFIINKAWAFKK